MILRFSKMPKANFTADEARFQSLMDGETVEIVSNEEFVDSLDDPQAVNGDNGIDGNNSGSNTNDDGVNGGDGGVDSNGRPMIPPVPGSTGRNGGGGYNGGDGGLNVRRDCPGCQPPGGETGRMGCKERLLQILRRIVEMLRESCPSCGEGDVERPPRGRAEMLTCPREIEQDRDMRRAISCGKNGKKVLVCHHPNNDYEKRMTKCVGASALQAFVGAGDREGNFDRNYAGPCKDLEDDEEEEEECEDCEEENKD